MFHYFLLKVPKNEENNLFYAANLLFLSLNRKKHISIDYFDHNLTCDRVSVGGNAENLDCRLIDMLVHYIVVVTSLLFAVLSFPAISPSLFKHLINSSLSSNVLGVTRS